ncbi:hypothetical protein QYE76_048534 [Lolium multiflorum]|uniref:Transposase (putative) gypsy type domain-containing protein n=1 Tax=Lolium multiflorum TaxID=4521 RepID=A0AAD8SMD8_LOLMU|nr:hypothetical protein QYE76_048534 [Lolium multiflorum]
MPPCKLTKHNAIATKMATEDLGNLEWERSKISQQDVNLLKKLGISGKQDALRFPKEESYPAPPMQYRVSFVNHLIRGLSTPIHDFLRGLLFMYGLQLHHLTPNSILHIAIFITLCESFLGVQPNWSLWKRIFFSRRNGSSSVAYNIGGVVICVLPGVEYFDVKFPDSVQGWRKKWLYIREENHGSVEDNIPPFDGAEKICRRRSWDAEATDAEKAATEALMTRIHELQNTRGQELSGPRNCVTSSSPSEGGEVEERAVVTDDNQGMSRLRVRPRSRKSAASSEKDVEAETTSSTHSPPSAASHRSKRKRDDAVDTGTSKAGVAHAEKTVPDAKKEALDLYEAALVSSGDEEEDAPIDETARAGTSRRTHQEYELENPEGDQLLDALSLLEIHGTEARDGLAEAEIGLSRLFPYFFKKKEEPAIFIDLAKCFTSQEDLGLQLRQEGLKVGVEGTMALVANSQQNVAWARVGDAEDIETKKWQSLIKAAKPNSKKILATLGYKPAPASSSKPEVK